MIRKFLLIFFVYSFHQNAFGQTKSFTHFQQIWAGYYEQVRFNKNWELNGDLHLRSQQNFVNGLSQSIIRFGVSYNFKNALKVTAGYAFVNYFPGDNHKDISQPERRPWQQFQWQAKYNKNILQHKIRLEERYRHKILNDSTLAPGFYFNWRLRYNVLYEVPLQKLSADISFILNEEVNINFGKEIVYNYFDQNRFFLGLKYHINKQNNVQFGYMNIFQQASSGNKYKITNVIRVFYFQNFDLSKKKKD